MLYTYIDSVTRHVSLIFHQAEKEIKTYLIKNLKDHYTVLQEGNAVTNGWNILQV